MKRTFAAAAALLFLLTAVICTGAVDNSRLLQPGCSIDGTTVTLYGRELPEGAVVDAAIDGISLDADVSTLGSEQVPITYYCLTEASTILSNLQITQRIDALNAISETMRPGDKMVIAALGSTLEVSEPLTDKEIRQEAIENISKNGRESSLFDTIAESIRLLEESGETACLVILSDGIDSGTQGTTEQMVVDLVAESRIPVFTIGLVNIGADQYALSNVQHIARIAEASLGGTAVTPTVDKTTAAECGTDVCNAMLNRSVIRVSIEGIPSNGEDRALTVSCEADGTQYESLVTLSADIFPAVEETVPESQSDADDGFLWEPRPILPLVLICAGVFVVLAVVLVTLLLRKKKKAAAQEAPVLTDAAVSGDAAVSDDVPPSVLPDESNNGYPNVQEYFSSSQYHSVLKPAPEQFLSADDFSENTPITPDAFSSTVPLANAAPVQRSCHVTVTGISNSQFHLDFQMYVSRPITLGRNRNSSVILNANDARLSGLHLEMEWDGEDIYVRDKKSTNGTQINGTALKPDAWFPLRSGDTVRAGTNDYRFYFQ